MLRFDAPEDLIRDLASGKMILLVDDENRENEGDLVLAADFVTPEAINFMAKEARGLICLALEKEQIDRLNLPLMVRDDRNQSPNQTAFTISIEASAGVSTGISASDRAHTVRVASRPDAKPDDVRSPGHIFPLRAQSGGVLIRAGHTEGSVDLARLAGLNPAAVICEVMNEDGSMARVPDLFRFARQHSLRIGTIVDLIEFRLRKDHLVEKVTQTKLNSNWGELQLIVFRNRIDGSEHLVVQRGAIGGVTRVRVLNHQIMKSLLSLVSGNRSQLSESLEWIGVQGGVLILLNSKTSLVEQVNSLQQQQNPFAMDQRGYGLGAQILHALGIKKIQLMNPASQMPFALKGFDIEIVEEESAP